MQPDSSSDLGETQVVVYLTRVTETEIQQVIERVCDILVEAGLGCERDHGDLRALVGLLPRPFPDLEGEGSKAFLDEHAQFAIPGWSDKP